MSPPDDIHGVALGTGVDDERGERVGVVGEGRCAQAGDAGGGEDQVAPNRRGGIVDVDDIADDGVGEADGAGDIVEVVAADVDDVGAIAGVDGQRHGGGQAVDVEGVDCAARLNVDRGDRRGGKTAGEGSEVAAAQEVDGDVDGDVDVQAVFREGDHVGAGGVAAANIENASGNGGVVGGGQKECGSSESRIAVRARLPRTRRFFEAGLDE